MNFNSLPTDCILHIFSRLPLRNLLQIEIVCHKWKFVQNAACRQRHNLLLLIGPGALDRIGKYCAFGNHFADVLVYEDGTKVYVSTSDLIKSHGLDCAELSEEICQWLVNKLPNVTSLQVAIGFRAYSMIDSLMSLLSSVWSSKISTLNLSLGNTAGEDEFYDDTLPASQLEISQNCWLLLGALRFLPSLAHLTLNVDVRFLGPKQMHRNSCQISLPILAQLQSFYICSFDSPDSILDSLVRFGEPNANLRQIGICESDITEECLDKFVLKLSPEFRSRFTHIVPLLLPASEDHYFDLELDLAKLCFSFPSQTSLHFNNKSELTFSETVNTLSSLKKLEFLALDYLTEFDHFHFDDPNILNCSIAQLSTVKVLCIDFYFTSHAHLSLMNICWIFPNLQALQIVMLFKSCVECDYKYENGERILEKYGKCLKKMLDPLKKCPRLRSLELAWYQDDKKFEWLNIDSMKILS